MSQADLSFEGLTGVLDAVVETAKRFRRYEEQYQANEAAFDRLQQQFTQMLETAGHLHSLTEERLAAVSALMVELKARHSQGEQALADARDLIEQVKLLQPKLDQDLAALGTRQQVDSERTIQLAHTLDVVQALVEQLQTRQGQLEQSLMTLDTLLRDQGKRNGDRDGDWNGVRGLAEQVAERQAQCEKALSIIQNTQQAEKGVISHFEKSLNTVRTMAVELEKRVGQVEVSLAAIKANGSDASNINLQSVEAARRLMEDLGERQATLQTLIDQAQQTAANAAEQVARVDEQVNRLEKTSALALEAAQSAAQKAAQALDQAAQAAASPAPAIVAAPDDPEQAATDFQGFLQRCQEDHQAALDRNNQLQAQMRAALKDLPAMGESAIQKFFEQGRSRLEQIVNNWFQHREQRVTEMESRFDEMLEKTVALHQQLEKSSAAAAPAAVSPEWAENLEALSAAHGSELRFLKTLLWITLAAVALSYGLIVYAMILRSPAS